MFPDFKGTESKSPDTSNFIQRLKAAVPNATLVTILNGPNTDELWDIAAHCIDHGLVPVISTDPRGLLGAFVTGYEFLGGKYPDSPIVRLDTAEHPPEFIPELLQELEQYEMVIGDLDFAAGNHLIHNSVDEFAHRDLFPMLFSLFTHGKLKLSCAHGFQAFRSGWGAAFILKAALRIVGSVEHSEDEVLTWGLDGAMALGAIARAYKTVVHPVPSESVRNRETRKVAHQTDNALRMLIAARVAYPTVF